MSEPTLMTENFKSGRSTWAEVLDKISDPTKRDSLITALVMLRTPYIGGGVRRENALLRRLLEEARSEIQDLRWRVQDAALEAELAERDRWMAERWRLNTENDRLRSEVRALHMERQRPAEVNARRAANGASHKL